MNIFVAKLNFDTRENDLQNAFEQYGEVDSVKIIIDRLTGKSKGFGFVEMPNDDEANNAIEALDGEEFDGRTIVVKQAEPRENRNNNRGGGGGGYRDNNRGGGGGGYRDNNRGGGRRDGNRDGGNDYNRRY